jgi:hypothetical protein
VRSWKPAAAALALLAGGTTACSGASSGGAAAGGVVPKSDLDAYITAVQAVRLPVNALLEKADPITDAYREQEITPLQASHRMAHLEAKFADYVLTVHQIRPSNPTLAALNRPYADTYYYEDAYLATLASDLREGDFDNLPNTQDQQRLAIIIWRTKLEIVAADSGVTLPPDLQQAGRGEIAPDSPEEVPSGKGGGSSGSDAS